MSDENKPKLGELEAKNRPLIGGQGIDTNRQKNLNEQLGGPVLDPDLIADKIAVAEGNMSLEKFRQKHNLH